MQQPKIIYFPHQLDVNNIHAVINQLNNLDQCDFIGLDFENCNWIEPIGFTVASSLIIYLISCLKKQVKVKKPINKAVLSYCDRIGFFEMFGIDTNSNNQKSTYWDTNTPLFWSCNNAVNQTYIEQVIYLIKCNQSISDKTEQVIKTSLWELFRNVFDHSETVCGYTAFAQWYPQKGKVCISVVDNGQGFLASLRKVKPILRSHSEAIIESVKQNISSYSSVNNSGMGLYTIKDFVLSGNGCLDIISHNSKVSFLPNKPPVVTSWPNSFPGAIVNIEIDPNVQDIYYFDENSSSNVFDVDW